MTVTGENETPALGGAAIEGYNASLIGVADADAVDATAGATVTSNAVKEALAKALAEAKGEAVVNAAAVAFTAGTYTGTAKGYNGPVEVAVTFSDSAVTAIEVGANKKPTMSATWPSSRSSRISSRRTARVWTAFPARPSPATRSATR